MVSWITRDIRSRRCLLENSQTVEFQSWKVNFKTEVCSETANPQLTLQWIKDVEVAKSIDVLMTSRSIVGRRDSPDYDIFDGMIASALKMLLDKHAHFRKRVRAQKYERFFRGRQIAHTIYEHFRATGAYEAVQGLSDLFSARSQHDDVQDFNVRWDQAPLLASETPTEMVLEGLYKSKLHDSLQLQTVLALYNQETIQNGGSGKQMDNVRKETHVVSVLIRHLETDARTTGKKDNRPLPHIIRRHRLADIYPQKVQDVKA